MKFTVSRLCARAGAGRAKAKPSKAKAKAPSPAVAGVEATSGRTPQIGCAPFLPGVSMTL